MKLKPGIQFIGKHFNGMFEVLSVDEERNELKVCCNVDGHESTWNLEHTLWGFELEEYTEIVVEQPKTITL